jgi:hypothetical protein
MSTYHVSDLKLTGDCLGQAGILQYGQQTRELIPCYTMLLLNSI